LAVAPDPHTHRHTPIPTLSHSSSADLSSMGLPTALDLYTYDPSAAAAILFTVLYSLFIGPHFLLSCCRCRSGPIKHRYTLCLLIAAIIFTAGYSIRIASIQVKNRGNISLYATSSSLIVISPIFVCATLYLLLARLIQVYLPLRNQTFFNVSPRLLGKLFILSDATSFMTQGAGSAIAASGNWEGSSETAGIDVLLVGLALQLSTFTFFLVVVWQFVCRVRMVEEGSFEPNLKKMLRGVFIAAIFVEVSEMPQPFLDGRRLYLW
jgi:RTA1 like protein